MTLYQATKASVKTLRPILLDKQQINENKYFLPPKN